MSQILQNVWIFDANLIVLAQTVCVPSSGFNLIRQCGCGYIMMAIFTSWQTHNTSNRQTKHCICISYFKIIKNIQLKKSTKIYYIIYYITINNFLCESSTWYSWKYLLEQIMDNSALSFFKSVLINTAIHKFLNWKLIM